MYSFGLETRRPSSFPHIYVYFMRQVGWRPRENTAQIRSLCLNHVFHTKNLYTTRAKWVCGYENSLKTHTSFSYADNAVHINRL